MPAFLVDENLPHRNGRGTLGRRVLIREERMQQIRAAWRRYVERDEYPWQSIVVLEAQKTRIRRFPQEEGRDDDR